MDLHLGRIAFLLLVVSRSLAEDHHARHMDNFIKAVETIEAENPGSGPLAVVRGLCKAAHVETPFIRLYLSDGSHTHGLVIKPELTGFITSVIKHRVTELGVEEGVVLTADGTTVALTPLLLGLEAGLQSTSPSRVRGLYPLTLFNNLVRSFLHHFQSDPSTSSRLGPGGCWDSVTDPQVFTLSGVASLATDSLITGGMDGAILGKHVAEPNNRPVRLSDLLKQYYNHRLDTAGLDAAPGMISQLRRTNFRKLVSFPLLKKQLPRSLTTYQKMQKYSKKQKKEIKNKKEEMLNEGLKEFVHSYMDCPAIIPRCMWEAQPYRGTPIQLTLPLPFLYIHHTYGPSQPCLTFQQCSRDMRSMQRFHQDDRGWDDIGYSFVAGSDGYLYEGRGWHWQGAHTKGHNSIGYGVSFIGDYTSSIPAKRTMDLVRHQLAKCATDGGRLMSNFTIHGHRQVVSTSCPGDTLYSEIQGWKHFAEVKN
ncbi:peptidoglycan recognition protein 6 isoform X2 [Colossoma macropomum]|uniref:peptidoglycan recognition protein 6 isoform X2 n=1 Tax=Colossoma macropomum TaxID=42526 RepID=UPI00186555F0|nr:peptidoglycan recognition protein 6 isoform X2 [Colossoma macropomum]